MTLRHPIARARRPVMLALPLLLLAGPLSASALVHGQGLLWYLEGPGYAPSYLFGTMHSTDKRVLDVPPQVRQAFARSQRYLFELIIPPDGFTLTVSELQMPQGYYLRDLVGDEVMGKIEIAAGRYGIPTAKIARMHPGALILALKVPPNEWLRRGQGWPFLDLDLQNRARQLGRPVFALETIEEQIAVDNDRETDLPSLLSGMIDNSFLLQQDFETAIRYYLSADLDAFFTMEEGHASRLIGEQRDAYRNYKKRLRDDRNRIMAERMLEHMRQAACFTAIGAAHLPGRVGVLRLLEERGFRVTRVY